MSSNNFSSIKKECIDKECRDKECLKIIKSTILNLIVKEPKEELNSNNHEARHALMGLLLDKDITK